MKDKKPKSQVQIPIMSAISKITGETVDEVYSWTEKDWLAFADRLKKIYYPNKI